MAHYIAIAKASLAAGLLRPDPTSVSREEIARFHVLLDGALSQCSPANVQKCKAWLLGNTTQSSARISALGKYLVALSASFVASEGGSSKDKPVNAKPSNKRRPLHILYLLNDLLHHTKYHSGSPSIHTSLTSNLQPHLVELVGSAASFESKKNRKLHKRIRELLEVWRDNGYYTTHYVNKLREAAENAGSACGTATEDTKVPGAGDVIQTAKKSGGKDAPFVMPASHGDAATPYYDLPAGNFMPHIVPNFSTPIDSSLVKPLQFMAGPADESLATTVKEFLKDAEAIYKTSYNFDEGIVADIDELGQPMVRDEATGELSGRAGYYGWSRAFCERMKKRRNGVGETGKRAGSSEYSRSGSRSREGTPRKRRRYSSSISSRSRSRSRSGGRSQDDSRSRSLSRSRKRRPSKLRRRSRSPSQSWSPTRRIRDHRSLSPSITRSQSPSRPTQVEQRAAQTMPPSAPSGLSAPTTASPFTFTQMPGLNPTAPLPTAALSALLAQGFPLGPGGVPVPPPPPFHSGPWPPPPPPIMPNMNFNPQLGQFPMFPGFTHPPPSLPSGPAGYQGFLSSSPPTGPAGVRNHNSSSPLQQVQNPVGNVPMQPRAFGGRGGFGGQNGWQQHGGYGQMGRGRNR